MTDERTLETPEQFAERLLLWIRPTEIRNGIEHPNPAITLIRSDRLAVAARVLERLADDYATTADGYGPLMIGGIYKSFAARIAATAANPAELSKLLEKE